MTIRYQPIIPKPEGLKCSLAFIEAVHWPGRPARGKKRAIPGQFRARVWCACGIGSGVLSRPDDKPFNRLQLWRWLKAHHPPSMLYTPELHVFPEMVEAMAARARKAAKPKRKKGARR